MALVFGGGGYDEECESFDGTSWTEVADMTQSKSLYNSGAGKSIAAIAPGGQGSGVSTQVEVWSFITTTSPGAQNVKIITD